MSKQSKRKKPARKQYTPEFRTEALALAGRVGIPEAARQLGIESQLAEREEELAILNKAALIALVFANAADIRGYDRVGQMLFSLHLMLSGAWSWRHL